jgi:hypothetical protein
MADIARMRFQSAQHPDESGIIALSSDGTMRIEPSNGMIEAVAALEQEAVEKSARVSSITAITLIGLGLAAAAIGWAAGRIGGRLRDRLVTPRSVDAAEVTYQRDRGFHLRFKQGPLQSTSLTWAPGEYDVDEAERFVDVYTQIRRIAANGTNE